MSASKTVYHASEHLFDRPEYEKLLANRTNHDNGALGFWCALEPSWIGGFGKHLYAVTYAGRALTMDITAFHKRCSPHELLNEGADAETYYRCWRDALMADGYDILEIKEHAGHVAMLIILNLEVIQSCAVINDPLRLEEECNVSNTVAC